MNIREAEESTGVSRQNIRFYEKQQLLRPRRNRLNAYREYGDEELRRLKCIRLLRMLNMPLDTIRHVLDGEAELAPSLSAQKTQLEAELADLKAAIRFCDELSRRGATLGGLDVDACLASMGQAPDGIFTGWVQDYKELAALEHERRFSFLPDGAVTNCHEFTNELFLYANEKHLNLVITKESMYPEFTIDGVPYKAERFYTSVHGIPVATIQCVRTDLLEPEALTPKQKGLRLVHIGWPALLPLGFLALTFPGLLPEMLTSWEGWLILFALAALGVNGVIRNYVQFWNSDGNY